MRTLLEAAGVLVILFLLLRVSLAARGHGFGLRGGLTTLNIASGALAGLAAAFLLAAGIPDGGAAADGAPGSPLPAGGYGDLAAALRVLAPWFGAALGGIASYQIFGAIWRGLFKGGTARARAWLLRAQFAILAASCVYLVGRLLA
jgi:hypothetical protein